MEIKLNIYPRVFEGEKSGLPFEPKVWHRVSFLQKNFIRFFANNYLAPELYVVVAPSIDRISSFEFVHEGKQISVVPWFY